MKPARILLAAASVALLASALRFAPPQGDAPSVQVQPVGGKVSVLFGQGGNIGVSVGDDGVLMIDTQFARMTDAIRTALASLSKDTPTFVINTHWHGDHTGGNADWSRGATILGHANVRTRLAGDASLGGNVEADPDPQAFPVVTYEDGVSIHFNGEEIRLIHVPNAHTDGDTVVWFRKSGVVHLGDLYFEIGYPFVDLASGGNVLGLIEGVRTVLAELPTDVRLIPGHGKPTGVDGLREYLAMLEEVTERVRKALDEGQDVAAMSAAGLTKDLDERWGKFDFVTPERFLQIVVGSLRQ